MIALIHIKKTAGKSVKHIMHREFGLHHCDVKRWDPDIEAFDAEGLERVRKFYPRLQSIAGHSIKAYSDLKTAEPDLRFYTFLRDPIKRTASQYQYRIRQGRSANDTFETWICDPRFRNVQVRTIAGTEDLDEAIRLLEEQVDFVGLQESFEESLAMMRPALALPAIDLSSARVNSASDNSVAKRLLADPDAVARLEQANRLDNALYAHVRDHIYPRQLARFGGQPQHAASAQNRPNGLFNGPRVADVYRQLVYRPAVWAYRKRHGLA